MEYNYRALCLVDCAMCNPNAEPHTGNPRIRLSDRRGVISQYAIKRKIKKRRYEQGEELLHYNEDGIFGKAVFEKIRDNGIDPESNDVKSVAAKFRDVRWFGALDMANKKKLSIKTPVSVSDAVSIDPVEEININSTRGYHVEVNENGNACGSSFDNEGIVIAYGLYRFFVGINAIEAVRTRTTDEDINVLLDDILHMFDNDYSTMRPLGSMSVRKLVVWRWKGEKDISDIDLFDSVHIEKKDDMPTQYDDYVININAIKSDVVETIIMR